MDMNQMAPFIGIGVVILMLLIIIPLALRFTRKKTKEAQDFFPELAQKTGLRVQYDKLVGNYKGFDVSLQYNVRKRRFSGNTLYYPGLIVEVRKSGEYFPSLGLYDTPGFFSYTQIPEIFTGKNPQYPKMNIDGSVLRKGIDVYGTDIEAGHQLVSSAELQQLISDWEYPDIRFQGETCKLTLETGTVDGSFGNKKIHTHDAAIQALNIAVAAAAAVS